MDIREEEHNHVTGIEPAASGNELRSICHSTKGFPMFGVGFSNYLYVCTKVLYSHTFQLKE